MSAVSRTKGKGMERISIRVEGQLKQRFETEAKAEGVSPSALVRRLLEAHYHPAPPQENCFHLATRLGILGSIKGLPAELSTNPNHVEGAGP